MISIILFFHKEITFFFFFPEVKLILSSIHIGNIYLSQNHFSGLLHRLQCNKKIFTPAMGILPSGHPVCCVVPFTSIWLAIPSIIVYPLLSSIQSKSEKVIFPVLARKLLGWYFCFWSVLSLRLQKQLCWPMWGDTQMVEKSNQEGKGTV